MGATNNKPLKSATKQRRRKSKNIFLQGNEAEVDGSNQYGMYDGPSRDINQVNANLDLPSSWSLQNQPYYNEQNLDGRSSNVQTKNFEFQEEFTQYPNNEYNKLGISRDFNFDRNEERTEEKFHNKNLNYPMPQSLSNMSMGLKEENSFWPDSENFKYGMSPPTTHALGLQSLNNDHTYSSFSQTLDFNHPQSHSLNNGNCQINSGGQFSSFGLTSYGNGSQQDLVNLSNLDNDSYVGPSVKWRSETQEVNFEWNNSALSQYNDTAHSDESDFGFDHLKVKYNDQDEKKIVLNILKFPSGWSSYSITKTGFVDIPSTSLEGEKLHRFFSKSSRTSSFQLFIVGIERIENPFLHTLYLLKKEELKLRNGHVDELHLFHGTKFENISQICEDNFNWRMYSEKHKFGMGISFSPFASYSSHYCDNSEIKVMLILKVLVSNSVIGTSEMEMPPVIDGVTYDTSIKEDTSVIVKYSDNEFYPLYKIRYTKRSS